MSEAQRGIHLVYSPFPIGHKSIEIGFSEDLRHKIESEIPPDQHHTLLTIAATPLRFRRFNPIEIPITGAHRVDKVMHRLSIVRSVQEGFHQHHYFYQAGAAALHQVLLAQAREMGGELAWITHEAIDTFVTGMFEEHGIKGGDLQSVQTYVWGGMPIEEGVVRGVARITRKTSFGQEPLLKVQDLPVEEGVLKKILTESITESKRSQSGLTIRRSQAILDGVADMYQLYAKNAQIDQLHRMFDRPVR